MPTGLGTPYASVICMARRRPAQQDSIRRNAVPARRGERRVPSGAPAVASGDNLFGNKLQYLMPVDRDLKNVSLRVIRKDGVWSAELRAAGCLFLGYGKSPLEAIEAAIETVQMELREPAKGTPTKRYLVARALLSRAH